MRPLLVVFSLILFPVVSHGEENCDSVADDFARLVNRASASVAVKVLGKEEAAARLEELLKVEVKTIFPETKSVRTGRRVTEIRVRDDAAAIDRYKRHFDDIWDMRVASGQMPKWKLKEYRDWLKAQSKSSPPSAYPEIKAKELHDDYFSDGGTIGEYLDFQYLDYLEATKAIRPENVEAYLRSLDPSLVKHLGRASWKKLKSVANSAWGGALGASVLMVATMPGEMVGAALGPVIQPIKDFFTSNLREASTQAVETITQRDWGALFGADEDAYVKELESLSKLTNEFGALNFDSMNRADIAKKFDEYTKYTSSVLPKFHKLVVSEQKDFETIWDQRLKDSREAILQMNLIYDGHKAEIERIKLDIEKSGGITTPGQLEKIADAQQKMRKAEDYIANLLADWLFYKQARGKDAPLEPALDRNYATIYEFYLIGMDPALLARAMNQRVQLHVEQLRQYSLKTKAKEDGTVAPKPEDQIKIENNMEIVPAIHRPI